MDYTIRPVTDEDRNTVIDIFNYYIENSFAAFFEKKVGTDFFEKFRDIAYGNAFYVLENADREVIGFGLLKNFHPSEVFQGIAEVGYFIKQEFTHKGLGALLLNTLTADAKRMGIKALLASISSLNEESIEFHRKHAFSECGRFKSIGQKHGKTFDVIWMQKFI